MTASYQVFIDESGDEGFKFLPDERGSSRWFVLSATIFRKSNQLAPVDATKEIKQVLKKGPKDVLHFRDLTHEKRIACVSTLAKHAFRTVSVASYKPDIPDPERYQANKYLLYRYLTRILLERVSWLCRDNVKPGEGDGSAELIFSDRSAMSYEDIRAYINLLKTQTSTQNIQIHWPAINPENIRAVQHAKLAGLQVADIVASSVFFALHFNQYGYAEPRYAQVLKGHAYKHRGVRLGYGLKFLSSFDALKEKMPHVNAAFGDW
jgi:hypothetical protein